MEYTKQLQFKENLFKECKWLPTEVCLNENKCRPKTILPIGYIFNRNFQCGCKNGAFSFRCGRKYCTSNKETCELFDKKLLAGNKYSSIIKCKK